MSKEYLRTFKLFDFDDVKQHLLIMGDLKGDCGNCRALGIDAYHVKYCLECKTEFKYVTSRRLEMHPGERFQLIRRLQEKRQDLLFVDYTDYAHFLGKQKVRDIFG